MYAHSILRLALVACTTLSGIPTASAHSWVEQLQRIARNGTMISPVGYQRGFVARDNPLFKGDISDDLRQLPPNGRTPADVVLKTDALCSPQASTSNYSADYPMLVTAPGDYIALRHEENGHVTLPTTQTNKPRNRGTIYIYGTAQARANDTLLAIHGVWNANGTGGDQRGRLLATRNYDDGQCYQMNDGTISTSRQKQFEKVATNPQGSDLWCQSDLQLPTDITTGANYTLYWVWDWPTLNKANAMVGEEGVNVTKPEIYTSCMDLQIVDPCSEELGDVKSPACSTGNTKAKIGNTFIKGQSYGAAAVPQELTGNFAVGVQGANADSGSNNGMSAPPNLATEAATTTSAGAAAGTATPSTFQTVTTTPSNAGAGAGGAQTVTVAASTVTVTQGVTTVTVTAGASSTASSTPALVGETDGSLIVNPQTKGVKPSVKPISRKRSRIEILN